MGGLVMAWLVGEGIIIYRSVQQRKTPPGPGQLALSSGVFVLLALLAEIPQAKTAATMLAWGFNIAAYTNLVEVGGKAGAIATKWPPASAPDTVILPQGKAIAD